MKSSTTVQRLVDWAEADRDVRAVLLVGSRGGAAGMPDRWSDHDVLIFVRNRPSYELDERWLTSFGPILVKLDEAYELLGTTVPTRLVQYRDGSRIDFSICDPSLLDQTPAFELPIRIDHIRTSLPDYEVSDALSSGSDALVSRDWAIRSSGPREWSTKWETTPTRH